MIKKPDRFEMGDKKRFHVRYFNLDEYQVYSIGLETWAICHTYETGKLIAGLLEKHYEEQDD